MEGNLKIVRPLIANRARINARDNDGSTPLMLSVDADAPTVKLLIQHGADASLKSKAGRTALGYASWLKESPEKHLIMRMLKDSERARLHEH
jgi:ankyrin repeat protein